ncbi:hypothetical protein [Psychrobium sp. 1_MG-2023]|uniref:hypothetical protein n=1 Tax=Psychrobium sp. 1_MG-2023 TaxID=3062624 RepID=UPI001291EDD7|nr:hypothetical protein [Psychrobium sp. 1_MG-2023]MDP2561194.1 hypothetical protein [Psychrobium sp. 1_MG-2023]
MKKILYLPMLAFAFVVIYYSLKEEEVEVVLTDPSNPSLSSRELKVDGEQYLASPNRSLFPHHKQLNDSVKPEIDASDESASDRKVDLDRYIQTTTEIVNTALKNEGTYDIDNDLYNLFDGLEFSNIESTCFDDKCNVKLEGLSSGDLHQVVSKLTYHSPWAKLALSVYQHDNSAEIDLIIKEH